MKADSIQNSVILFILIYTSSTTAHKHRGMRRGGAPLSVHQGENVTHEQYPYVMALVLNQTKLREKLMAPIVESNITTVRLCTCSLIRPDWVLIAAHCVMDVKKIGKEFFKIIYGDLLTQPDKTKFQRSIRKVIVHLGFTYFDTNFFGKGVLKNDIALLLIDPIKAIRLSKLSAIDYKSFIGYPVKYLGTGSTHSLSNFLNKEKKLMLDIQMKDQTRPIQIGEAVVVTCDKTSQPHIQTVYPGICVYSRCSNSKQSAMPGDSGSPLLYKNKIIGVSSVSGLRTLSHIPIFKKDSGNAASVYTAVGPYLEWINRVISQEGNCSTTTETSGVKRRVPMS